MALALVRLLAYARILAVEEFGVFSAGVLISSSFCMLGCFGLMPMLQREWPTCMVHGQHRRAWVRAAQCFTVATAASAIFIMASATGWSVAGMKGGALVLAIVYGLAQQLFLIVTTESRSAGNALQYAWQQFARGVALAAGGVLLALGGGGAIELIAFEAGITIVSVLVITARGVKTQSSSVWLIWSVAMHRLRHVSWATALTMMSVMLVSFAMVNIDRWLASNLLDAGTFGLYSFAAITLAVAQACQALINASGYPLIARRYAAEGSTGAIRVSMRLSAFVATAGLCLLIPIAWIGQIAVERGYPDYAVVGSLVPWLAAIGLLRMADFWSSFLIIGGHEVTVLRLNGMSLVAALIAWSFWAFYFPGSTSSPASFVVLAGLVTAFGASATFIAAQRIALKHRAHAVGQPA